MPEGPPTHPRPLLIEKQPSPEGSLAHPHPLLHQVMTHRPAVQRPTSDPLIHVDGGRFLGRVGCRVGQLISGHAPEVRRPGSRWGGAVERLSAFQAGHFPSWRRSCERYALSPVAVACNWSLLLLSPLLSTRRKLSVPIGPAACRGWPASGPGRLRPVPWFLTGVSAETPGSSMTSRVRPPGTFSCARCPAVPVMLEAGGADTYTRRAIPGSEPSQGLCTFPVYVVGRVVIIAPGVRPPGKRGLGCPQAGPRRAARYACAG